MSQCELEVSTNCDVTICEFLTSSVSVNWLSVFPTLHRTVYILCVIFCLSRGAVDINILLQTCVVLLGRCSNFVFLGECNLRDHFKNHEEVERSLLIVGREESG